MKVIKIDKNQWSQSLEKLRASHRLLGPAKEKTYYTYQELPSGQDPELAYLNTRLSPKSTVFPQSETMMTYSLDETQEDAHVLKAVDTDDTSRVVLGMRPCDAKALMLVKMNFDTDSYKDPYWLNLYNATTFVGLACDTPCKECFCTSAGCGPFHEEGLDILLVDGQDHYLAKVITEKGQVLADAAGWIEAGDGTEAIEKKKADAEAAIASKISTEYLAAGDTLALHEADFWEDVSFACINCGTCTFVCPTCWCFDIQDEVQGKSGRRMRNWDSCMFPIFTVHTTGHNPRETKVQRLRQRFMHKLKYFVDKYNTGIMCVGCGRCIRQCPVNIDIRRVSELMNKQASENICAV
jgi:ferredoxin